MIVTKTIKCKIIGLTQTKQQLLTKEYVEAIKLNEFLNNIHKIGNPQDFNYKNIVSDLYSITKANSIYKFRKGKRNQLLLPNQVVKLMKQQTKLSSFWLRIPIFNVRGGIWVALGFGKKYVHILDNWKLRDSFIMKKNNEFYAYLTFQKEVEMRSSYENVLAIDLGEKVIATVCDSFEQRPRFYGGEVRGIRRHYAWLRKRLGNKKLLKKIKSIGQTEQRKVDAILHKISRDIVDLAYKNNALIVLGNLKGIRNNTKRGKRFNRIVSSMPFYKLTQFIEYKANSLGIGIVKVNEKHTSKTCPRCGKIGVRKNQGLFVCSNCNFQLNADYNGAKNILKRSLEHVFSDGVIAYAQKPLIEKASTY
ncbi:MAG: transposase [archaeon]|nr:transposase [archaeon]